MSFFKLFFTIFIFTATTFAITLQELRQMPKSIERDFFIWRFISDKNTTKAQAKQAIALRKTLNGKLKSAYFKKTGIKLSSPHRYRPTKKNLKDYKAALKELKNKKNLYQGWLDLDEKKALSYFNLSGRKNRKLLNKEIPSSKLIALSKFYGFNEFLYRVNRENLKNIQKAILKTKFPQDSKIRYKYLLSLAFKALQQGDKTTAAYFFNLANIKTNGRFEKDKTLFWLYMTTKDTKYLHKLAKSYDYNMYKFLALDFLNRPYPTPTKTPFLTKKNAPIDISDPIEWAKLKKKLFSKHKKHNLYELAKTYASKESLAYYVYILTKASNYTHQYFPIVYKEYIKDFSIHRQALILALAKQESQFISSAISRSFAVGLMQFMPFLVKEIAAKKKINLEIEDMFKPKYAIDFANTHLDYLEKYLYNPALVAYAYNGGITFTRRLVRNKKYFQNKEYEPYLSMELVPKQESNLYAKKVIANYVMYRKLLGSPIRVKEVLNKLITTKAHKF